MSWGKKKWRNRDPLCICFTVGEKEKEDGEKKGEEDEMERRR